MAHSSSLPRLGLADWRSLNRKHAVRLGALSASLLIACALGAGCAGKKSASLSPEAQAAVEQRAQARQEAHALRHEQNQLQVSASRNDREAQRLRNQALVVERQGLTNVAAGEAICDAGDCARGCEIIDRGEARLELARQMRQQADDLDAQSSRMRGEASLLEMEARDIMASIVD